MSKRVNSLSLENDVLKVDLDPHFPRILKYLFKPNGGVLYGYLPEEPGIIEINGIRFDPKSFRVEAKFSKDAAEYVLRLYIPNGYISFDVSFRLEGNTVVMVVDNVKEKCFNFLLHTIYFPTHRLLAGKASDGAYIFRPEFYRLSWYREKGKGLFLWRGDSAGKVSDFQPENDPVETFWAMVYTDKVLGTIYNSTPIFPLRTQLTGYCGYDDNRLMANEFSIWNSPYHYRVQDEIFSPFTCKIGLVDDLNEDCQVNWMDGARWLRKYIPDANLLYDNSFIYKIGCARAPSKSKPTPTVLTTFDECLEIIKKIYFLTNGAKQIVYLVGWQHEGHDSKYPDLSVVNPLCGGKEKLIHLIKEAKKYNAIVSLHVNFDDAYQDSPAWDPEIICIDREGDLQKWEIFHDEQAYHISHYKDCKKGSAFRRIDGLLEMLPIEQTIHLDAFRYTNESWDPDGYKDMLTEFLLGFCKIVDYFKRYGIDVTTEGYCPGLERSGISVYWHLETPKWRFIHLLMHRKWHCGNRNVFRKRGVDDPPERIIFGESGGADFHKGTPITFIVDGYYLKTLLHNYLHKYEMLNISENEEQLIIKYGEKCIAKLEKNSGNILVMDGSLITAKDDDRFIPINEREILAYSKGGGSKKWKFPDGWSNKEKIRIFRLTEFGREEEEDFTITQNNEIALYFEPQQPYIIIREV